MNLLTKKEPVCHKLFVSNFFLSAYRMRKNEKVAVCGKIFSDGKNTILSDIFLSFTAKICSLSIKI